MGGTVRSGAGSSWGVAGRIAAYQVRRRWVARGRGLRGVFAPVLVIGGFDAAVDAEVEGEVLWGEAGGAEGGVGLVGGGGELGAGAVEEGPVQRFAVGGECPAFY